MQLKGYSSSICNDIQISGRDPNAKSTSKIHNVFEDKVVVRIAKAHGKTPAQVLLRHQVQNGIIVIPKSVKKLRIKENFGVFDFSLTDPEMKELDAQDKGTSAKSFNANFMDFDREVETLRDYPWGPNSPDNY